MTAEWEAVHGIMAALIRDKAGCTTPAAFAALRSTMDRYAHIQVTAEDTVAIIDEATTAAS